MACAGSPPAFGQLTSGRLLVPVLFQPHCLLLGRNISYLMGQGSSSCPCDFSALCGNNGNDVAVELTADILAAGSLKARFFCSPYAPVRIFYSRPFVMCD